MSGLFEVMAYGVAERDGGPLIHLAHEEADAVAWSSRAASEYRNQNISAPRYRYVELIDSAAVDEMIDTLRMSAEALESAAKCVGGDLAIVLGDRARFARNALARVSGGAA